MLGFLFLSVAVRLSTMGLFEWHLNCSESVAQRAQPSRRGLRETDTRTVTWFRLNYVLRPTACFDYDSRSQPEVPKFYKIRSGLRQKQIVEAF